MGATSIADADEGEVLLNLNNDKDYLNLCGLMALKDEITRGYALRDLKTRLGSLNAGVRRRPKMIDGSSRKTKRKNKPSKKKTRSRSSSCKKQPCREDICLVENIFNKTTKECKKDKPKRKTRRKKEKKCKEICPLGVLELAVPNKRLCLETWRQYSHVLPDYAIARLKDIILDQKPIIEVSAAIECFNLSKSKCKKLALKRKRQKLRKMLLAKNKKRVPNRISRICAKLAREMLNNLKTPKVIELDSHGRKLASVIFNDITNMLRQMKAKHLMKKHFMKDAARKAAVWVETILEEYNDLLVYDEIRDLEEVEGPILDILDEILDHVLDFCVPIYKMGQSESALNYFSGDISLAGEGVFRKGSRVTEKESHLDELGGISDLASIHAMEDTGVSKYNLGIKLRKDIEDLDSDVRRDIIETAGEVTKSITDMAEAAVTKSLTEMDEANQIKQMEDDIIVLAKPRSAKSSESEVEGDRDKDVTLNKELEKAPQRRSISNEVQGPDIKSGAVDENKEAQEISNKDQVIGLNDAINKELDVMRSGNIDLVNGLDDALHKETNEMKSSNTEQEKGPDDAIINKEIEMTSGTKDLVKIADDAFNKETNRMTSGNTDQANGLDIVASNKDSNEMTAKNEVDIRDQGVDNSANNASNQKPEGDPESNSRNDKPHAEQSARRSSNVTFKNQKEIKIGPMNDDLLSEADEKWPKDIPFPVIKPSVSVTQSVTTLGNITESEETVKEPTETIKKGTEMETTTTDNEDKDKKKTEEFQTPPLESDNLPIALETPDTSAIVDESNVPQEPNVPQEFITNDKISQPVIDESEEYNIPKDIEPSAIHDIDTLESHKPPAIEAKELDDTKFKETEEPKKDKPYKPKEIQQLLKEMERDMKKVEAKRQQSQQPHKDPGKSVKKTLSPTRKDTKIIFDYKVRPETAPAWLLKRVCSCRDTINKEYDQNLQTCVHKKEQLRNVFRESENLVKSLELWNRWIASTCEQIITLKQTTDDTKYEEARCSATRCTIRRWRHLQTNINQATEQWRHCKISIHNKIRKSQKLLLSKY